MVARRWLLMLGSNLSDDALVHEALRRLQAIGATAALTPVRRFPSHDGRPVDYANALAELSFDDGRAALDASLKRLERALGRDRAACGQVAIDIDILAWREEDGWRADEHAQAKGEFERPPVQALLRESGQPLEDKPAAAD